MKKIKPKPGQESVWDYPRPPAIEKFNGHIRVIFGGEILADSNQTYRILETSHPPVFYIPPSDVKMEYLSQGGRNSFCEWKGMASYYHIQVGEKQENNACWYYPKPSKQYEVVKDYIAFYPSKMDACYVNDELVQSQEGDFYGGWITKSIVGPFKGAPGTMGW